MAATRLLFVDDEPSFLYLLEVYFGDDPGTEVLTTSGAEEALRLAAEAKPNFIFIDSIMPRIDGDNLARALRSTAPDAKLISLSGMPRDPEWADATHVKSGEILAEIRKMVQA